MDDYSLSWISYNVVVFLPVVKCVLIGSPGFVKVNKKGYIFSLAYSPSF